MLKTTRVLAAFGSLLLALSMSSTVEARGSLVCAELFGETAHLSAPKTQALNAFVDSLLQKPAQAMSEPATYRVFRGLRQGHFIFKVISGGEKKRIDVGLAQVQPRAKIQYGSHVSPERYVLQIERMRGDRAIDSISLPFERMWETQDGRTIRYSRRIMTSDGPKTIIARIHQGYAFGRVHSFGDIQIELQP